MASAESSGFASRLSSSPEVAFKSHFLVATEAQLQMFLHCIWSLCLEVAAGEFLFNNHSPYPSYLNGFPPTMQ